MKTTTILWLFLVTLVAANPAGPPVPKGYASKDDVMKAIMTGKVKTISPIVTVPPTVQEHVALTYSEVNDRKMKLDLYAPKEKSAKLSPLLVFIHGGAWSGGNRLHYKYYCVEFAKRGYVAATISYRLSDVAPFPAALDDCRSAVNWLRKNAEKYNIDPDRIALVGGSAGGHLAMLTGYSANDKDQTGAPPKAVVNIYGVYDMTTDLARNNNNVRKFLGGTFEEKQAVYEDASPKNHLDKNDPPTLVIHGTIDDVVPISQSDNLVARLEELGIPHTYEKLEGWPHALDIVKPVNDRCIWAMERFFEEHLR